MSSTRARLWRAALEVAEKERSLGEAATKFEKAEMQAAAAVAELVAERADWAAGWQQSRLAAEQERQAIAAVATVEADMHTAEAVAKVEGERMPVEAVAKTEAEMQVAGTDANAEEEGQAAKAAAKGKAERQAPKIDAEGQATGAGAKAEEMMLMFEQQVAKVAAMVLAKVEEYGAVEEKASSKLAEERLDQLAEEMQAAAEEDQMVSEAEELAATSLARWEKRRDRRVAKSAAIEWHSNKQLAAKAEKDAEAQTVKFENASLEPAAMAEVEGAAVGEMSQQLSAILEKASKEANPAKLRAIPQTRSRKVSFASPEADQLSYASPRAAKSLRRKRKIPVLITSEVHTAVKIPWQSITDWFTGNAASDLVGPACLRFEPPKSVGPLI